MQITFQEKLEVAPNVWQLTFVPNTAVEYVPGQYARFTFPFRIDDPRGKQHRTFSFISHPSEQTIRFITRLDSPLSTHKQALSALKPGDTMQIDEPHGDAILPRLQTTPLVFVAQGIAIASYISMLRDIELRGLANPVSLLWTRRPEDASLRTLVHAVTLAHELIVPYPGRLKVDEVMSVLEHDSLIYLSGSQRFVELLGSKLESHGIPRERIIYDYYSGYTDL